MARGRSRAPADRTRPLWPFLLVAGALAVLGLALEVYLPPGAASGAAYTLLVLLGLRAPRAGYIPAAAAAATLLTILGGFIRAGEDQLPVDAINRGVTVAAVWLIAGLLARFRRAEDDTRRTLKELSDFKFALDQAAIVAITDRRGIITYANDKFCEISKYRREELLGQDHRIVNSGYHPKEFMRDLWRTIGSGRVWRGEIRNRAKDGTYYWVDTTIVPFLDERGRPYRYLAIRADITERKRAEQELRRQEALAQLGQLAAVVAHEVKNPLAGIAGAIEVIGSRLPETNPDRAVVRTILERIEALNRRLQDVLRFARPRPPQRGPVRLLPLLRETASLLERDPGLSEVRVRLEGEDARIAGDAEQLRDLFLNLLLNAAQAMEGRGEIHVRVGCARGRCTVEILDQGPGIPREIAARVFEPFFTTKSQGTGLGLAIARRVVEDHEGSIHIGSGPRGGTLVRVELPAAPLPVPAAAAGSER